MSWNSVPFPLFVARRYLRSSRRDAFVTFLSLTAAGGIALGVAALILSSSALSGFQSVLRDEVLARSPHIEVKLAEDSGSSAAITAIMEIAEVESAKWWIRGRGWVLAAGRLRPVEIIGFEESLPGQFPEASGRDPGLYLSARLAQAWGLSEGGIVEVVSARPTLTPLGPQPRVKRVAIEGTFRAARSEQAERIALPIREAEQLFGVGARRILVTCSSLAAASSVAEEVRRVLGDGVEVETWEDMNRALFFLLRLEKTLMFLAVFLIVVVAAMAVISDLMLILAHKQSEMGMLGAMGSSPQVIRQIFLWLGGLLIGIGCGVGVVLGIGGAWLLDRYRLLALPGDVYFVDHVPFLVRLPEVALIVASTVLLTLACSWFAASRAGSLQPVEALKR